MSELRKEWSLVDVMEANDWLNIKDDMEWLAHKKAIAKNK